MGEADRRAKRISILIPERGRPESLERTIASILETADGDAGFEIIVGLDADDPAWSERLFPLHSHTRSITFDERPATLGEKLNKMAAIASGSILWFLGNDVTVTTKGWPEMIRAAVAKFPNGIGVGFPDDPLHPGWPSYPFMTTRQRLSVGYFMPAAYPYWFIDTHWFQIGVMLGQLHPVGVKLDNPDGRGKTHGKVDLEFWCRFFTAVAPLRMKDAMELGKIAYGDNPLTFNEFTKGIANRFKYVDNATANLMRPDFWHQHGGDAESDPGPFYPQVRAAAEKVLEKIKAETPRRVRVGLCVPSGRTWEAAMANSFAALAAASAMYGIELSFWNTQSSVITQSRNATVRKCLENQVDYLFWIDSDMVIPPDALARLLRHDKDIVGATYNQRVKPYRTLGLLEGLRPEQMHGGLHKASLLPSGCLLVKSAVYRKMMDPWYFEAMQWPGKDGLEAFKNLTKHYFWQEVPDEVLASLDGTAFGEWLKDGYRLGEHGEPFSHFSEDMAFCRNARRAGFDIWMDLDLTHQLIHLGTLEVSCLPPETAAMQSVLPGESAPPPFEIAHAGKAQAA